MSARVTLEPKGDPAMQHRPTSNSACVMIVEQDIDFGNQLVDWLTSQGYQPVLLRSIESAFHEVWDIRPQAIFVGITSAALSAQVNLFKLLHTIETIDPHIPVFTMGKQAVEGATDIAIRQTVRRFLAKPFEIARLHDLLQSELNISAIPATAVAV
jgi:DNA-binding NtrC family response regulator